MSLQIIPFEFSITTCYLIRDRGTVLVDAALPGSVGSFSGRLARYGIRPEEVQLIILTHGDFDHMGGAAAIRQQTGAKIVIHEKDRYILEQGIFSWSPGITPWGKVSRALLKPLMMRVAKPDCVVADIVLDDRGMSLEPYGIPGRIVHTPGHTSGSVSVVLDSGDACIGCLAHNRLPFRMKPGLPIYAADPELLKRSWKRVLDMGTRTAYPGHGKPFPVEKIIPYLN
jgi:hydroxyacylglutathione hydrolase